MVKDLDTKEDSERKESGYRAAQGSEFKDTLN